MKLHVSVSQACGEQFKDPRRSLTPIRKDHMDKTIRAVASTRSQAALDLTQEKIVLPPLHPSDVHLG
jgi:hypothetical protein